MLVRNSVHFHTFQRKLVLLREDWLGSPRLEAQEWAGL